MKRQMFLTIAVGVCLMLPLLVLADDICLQTSNELFAGTDADIYVKLYGDQDTTGWIFLETANWNDFEMGSNDCFSLDHVIKPGNLIKEIGIKAEFDWLPFENWHLLRAKLHFKGKCYHFSFDSWFGRGNAVFYRVPDVLPVC